MTNMSELEDEHIQKVHAAYNEFASVLDGTHPDLEPTRPELKAIKEQVEAKAKYEKIRQRAIHTKAWEISRWCQHRGVTIEEITKAMGDRAMDNYKDELHAKGIKV